MSTLPGKIGYSIANEKALLPLSAEERDAILRVLDDPPAGLVELRNKLAQRERVG